MEEKKEKENERETIELDDPKGDVVFADPIGALRPNLPIIRSEDSPQGHVAFEINKALADAIEDRFAKEKKERAGGEKKGFLSFFGKMLKRDGTGAEGKDARQEEKEVKNEAEATADSRKED